MDFLTVGFLLIIVIASGGIAVLADELGRKLGKKRLSFRNMRPKHVARAGVFLSGIAVSVITIGLVGVFSRDVRQWIFQGRQAIVQLQSAQKELESLQEEQKNLNVSNQRLRSSNANLSESARRLREQISRQQREISQGNLAIRQLQERVARANQASRRLDQQFRNSQARLQERQRALRTAQEQLAAVRERIATANRTVQNAVREFNEVNRQNASLGNEVLTLERSITALRAEVESLQSQSLELDKQRDQAKNDLATAENELTDARRSLNALNTELTNLRAEFRLSQTYYSTLATTFRKTRTAPITYFQGDEVVRYPLPRGMSAADAERALTTFLSLARTSASGRGAASNGNFDAADIVDQADPVQDRVITAAEQKAALIRRITNLPETGVLIGFSSLNAFQGEPVSLDIALVPNPMIYPDGTRLAEGVIDGSKDSGAVYDQIAEMLQTKITPKARTDKMIPRNNSDNPFGTVSTAEILNLVESIRAVNRRVLLRVFSDGDTRAADSLRLRFSIR